MSSFLRSKAFHTLLGIGVSLALIGWMVVEVDWRGVQVKLAEMRWWAFLPITGVMVVHYALRSLRWRYLLARGSTVPFGTLWDGIFLGIFATYTLPLRAGEIVRPWFLATQSPISFSTGLVSVVIERFFDLAVVLICFALVMLFLPDLPPWVQQGAGAFSVLAGAIFVGLVVAILAGDTLSRVIDVVTARIPGAIAGKLGRFAKDLVEGTAVLRKPSRLAVVVGLSLLVWATCFLQFFVSFLLFDIPLDPRLAVTAGVIVALAVAAPSAPGFIGVYQAGCMAAFSLFGVEREVAVAFALVTHVHMYILFIGYGPVILSRKKLSLRSAMAEQG